MAEKMRIVAQKLNLKSHLEKHGSLTVYSATDLEGHIGNDGRRYILDFSRVMPPEYPMQS
jgi:hypothetical protein